MSAVENPLFSTEFPTLVRPKVDRKGLAGNGLTRPFDSSAV
jgi:hypothetical protein